MNGVLHFLLSSHKKYDWFIVFNIDQPFKDPNLLYNVIRAINDNYDSLTGKSQTDEIVIPFKNLINDAYCRDISIKIRSHLDVKRRKGEFIGSFTIYGYAKDEATGAPEILNIEDDDEFDAAIDALDELFDEDEFKNAAPED